MAAEALLEVDVRVRLRPIVGRPLICIGLVLRLLGARRAAAWVIVRAFRLSFVVPKEADRV